MAKRPVVLRFEAHVGAIPFACGVTFDGLGTTRTKATFADLRLYVHDVRVTTASGDVDLAVELDNDGVWQNDGLALLDFEGAGCAGNAATHMQITGSVPARAGAITGVSFTLGVPARLNHLELATAPSPRNLSAMYWGWEAGYKYLRIEGRSTESPSGFRYHLGATGCAPSAAGTGFACAEPHLARVVLGPFEERSAAIVVDLASLFASANLDEGCMGESRAPACAPFLSALGLDAAEAQRLFRVRPRGAR